MCGNGLRCAVLLAYRHGLIDPTNRSFNVTTPSGIHLCECLDTKDDFSSAQVRIQLGIPLFDWPHIPIDPDKLSPFRRETRFIFGKNDEHMVKVNSVNTGSTHSVIFVAELPEDEIFFSISPQIENHPAFPERTSVIWAQPKPEPEYDIRIWERGAGETLGCGTGACAVTANAVKLGYSNYGHDLRIDSKGGSLVINWPSENEPILMTGPAEFVYEGEIIF
jgi:diaminopimelate epimerase